MKNSVQQTHELIAKYLSGMIWAKHATIQIIKKINFAWTWTTSDPDLVMVEASLHHKK